ncbi:MAG TPA: aminotransferase class V-fold PLP-dependent enzyme, partial [Gemmatimonadales bacterium]|nr:aminotransferase class V-fold PLP-dependent enzyme [Gemmatimonadales bacterium]
QSWDSTWWETASARLTIPSSAGALTVSDEPSRRPAGPATAPGPEARSSLTDRSPIDLAELRRAEFPWTADTIYLNNASIGPLPERTRCELEAFNRKRAAPFQLPDREIMAMMADSRRLAAELIGAAPEEIALTINTGFGLSLAARALPLKPGDIVLASDREFPANVYPWMLLKDAGVTLELVPTTPEGWPDEARLLERLADPRVRVLAVSLVQFSNGYRVDLDRLSRATRASGTYLVVDAIQAVGQLPVDLRETPVDVLSCGGQKWLLSPWGSGFVYVRRALIRELRPSVTGWMAFEGTDDFTRLTQYNDSLRGDARRFELITLPYQEFAGMNTSLRLLLSIGIQRIADHLQALHVPVLEWARRRGVRVASPAGQRGSGILCVAPADVGAAFRFLKLARVVSSLREGAIRFSPHFYNTVEEMERVVATLEKL